MKNLILFCLFILGTSTLFAQNFLHGQYQLLPLNLNPAMAGGSSSSQLSTNLRREGFSLSEEAIYLAGAINFDKPFLLKNGDKIGGGLKFNFSRDGSSAGFQNVNPAVDFSYQKRILKGRGSEHFLSGGMELGYLNRSFFFNELIIVQDPEEFGDLNGLDLGFGLNYQGELTDGKYLNIGVAGFQLTEEVFQRAFSINASADLSFSERIDIRPRILFAMYSGFAIVTPGIGGRFFFGEDANTSLEVGLGGRWLNFTSGTSNDTFFNGALFSVPTFPNFKENIGFSVLTETSGQNFGSPIGSRLELGVVYRWAKN